MVDGMVDGWCKQKRKEKVPRARSKTTITGAIAPFGPLRPCAVNRIWTDRRQLKMNGEKEEKEGTKDVILEEQRSVRHSEVICASPTHPRPPIPAGRGDSHNRKRDLLEKPQLDEHSDHRYHWPQPPWTMAVVRCSGAIEKFTGCDMSILNSPPFPYCLDTHIVDIWTIPNRIAIRNHCQNRHDHHWRVSDWYSTWDNRNILIE